MKIQQLKKLQEIWERRQILVDMISEMKTRMQSAFESECDFDLEIKDKVEGSNSFSMGSIVSRDETMSGFNALVSRLYGENGVPNWNPGSKPETPSKSKTNHKTIMKGLTNLEGMMVFQLLIDLKTQELKEVEKELIENGLDLKP